MTNIELVNPTALCRATGDTVEVRDIKYGVVTVKYPSGDFLSLPLEKENFYFHQRSMAQTMWLAKKGVFK